MKNHLVNSKLLMSKLKTLLILVFNFWLVGCGQETAESKSRATHTTTVVTNDTIPELRPTISKKPVASYLVQVNDPKLERTFGLKIYETKFTFRYLMRMHYEAVEYTDTLDVPNFGRWPVVEVRKGKDARSCIIGFLDNENRFREYKKLSAKGNKMKLIVLKRYSTGHYRNVTKE
jgi:hypothetical protein